MANATLWQELDASRSIDSLVSLVEPRICFNDDCLFPMGPACKDCANAYPPSVSDFGQKADSQQVGSAIVDGGEKQRNAVSCTNEDNLSEASSTSTDTRCSRETIIVLQNKHSDPDSSRLLTSLPRNPSPSSEYLNRTPVCSQSSKSPSVLAAKKQSSGGNQVDSRALSSQSRNSRLISPNYSSSEKVEGNLAAVHDVPRSRSSSRSIPAIQNQSPSQVQAYSKSPCPRDGKNPPQPSNRPCKRNIGKWLKSVPNNLAEGEDSYQSLKSSEARRTSNLTAHNLNSGRSTIDSKPLRPMSPKQPSRSPRSSFSSNPSTLSATAGRLDNWLGDIFNNTLEGQVNEENFNGGANEENTTLDFCPLCYAPIGDPRDQHLLRCQYAHDEAERSGASIKALLKRNQNR